MLESVFTVIKKFLLSLIFFFIFLVNVAAAQIKITALDVEQGDSFLIETDTENILIDTGDVAARDYLLNYFSTSYIDKLILTHPHADHIANAANLIKNNLVGAVYDNGRTVANKYYLNYLAQLKKKNIPRYTLREGDIFFLDDGAYLEILSANRYSKNMNNDSVVCKLVYGNFSMLFTGDIEAETETELFQSGYNLQSTILKAAHHGSKTSNSLDFITAVNPQYVLISAAFNNKFGHPHAAALDNFILAGVNKNNIFCTAFNGSVTITTDGETFTITPERQVNWIDNYLGYILTITDITDAY